LEFDGDVEDVFARTFVVDYEEYGTVKTTELVPGGDSIPVTKSNREEYVDLYVKWLLVDSIEAQFSAFSEGFHEVKPPKPLNLNPSDGLHEVKPCTLHHPHDKHSISRSLMGATGLFSPEPLKIMCENHVRPRHLNY
jgi:hypothetical protein